MRAQLATALLLAALAAACSAPRSGPAASPPPTPTPVPPRASENPEDVRARVPLRPTPFEPESKFPPPQQSREEEERTANKPGEPNLLHGEPAIFLDGERFPEQKQYDPKFPEARRLRYVLSDAPAPGDGTLEHPWRDLQEAFCSLEPGDRLVVAAGIYAGAFRISGRCKDGTPEAPIQVFARHSFFKSSGAGDVLTVERAHWQFWEVQIALLDSESAGFVTSGAGAHDIALDQTHIYEGRGPAVRLAAGSSRITLSNCHIHHSNGVRIEAGVSGATLINNHMHHNRASSVAVGGGADGAPAKDIAVVGNRFNNDHGPALDLARCEGVTASRNRLSNYRADEGEGEGEGEDKGGGGGEAVRIRSGCAGVVFENGSILEASVAVRIGDASDPGPAPRRIAIRRSFFRNTLTPESTALLVARGEEIGFYNNVIDRYAEPLRIESSARAVSIANDLILRPTVAFTLGADSAISLFDYVWFGADPSLPARVGGQDVSAAEWIRRRMPHSRVLPELALSDDDLARVRGASPVDQGTPVDGAPFRGAAPDVGVAEH